MLDDAKLDFEIVFVDDGSTDNSGESLNEIGRSDKRVIVVELARNFGHQVAITAGLDYARGRAVAVMDARPARPPRSSASISSPSGAKGMTLSMRFVSTERRAGSKEPATRCFIGCCDISHIEIPLDAGDFCIMDRRVVELLKGMPERNRFVRGIRSWVGLQASRFVF